MVSLPRATRSPPIGRAREMTALDALIEQVAGGEKRAGALVGPAGIGKTVMLRWARERADEKGFLTAFVRAPQSAGLPPRFPIGELLGGLIDACNARRIVPPEPLRKVVDTLRGKTTAEDYPADLPQIAEAIEQTAQRAPVALFVDDYQWAPTEGVNLLTAALRTIDASMLFAVTVRGELDEVALPESSADLWFTPIEVRLLERPDVERLAAAELNSPVLSDLVDHLEARTLGNALFVVETLRTWTEAGVLTTVGDHLTVADPPRLPTLHTLRDTIRRRLSNLDRLSSDVIAILALLGRDATFEEVRAISGVESSILIDSLARLADSGTVVSEDAPPVYRLMHPLYQSFVSESLGPTRRGDIHQRIYEALQSRSVRVAELAHHAVLALERPVALRDLVERAAGEAESAGSSETAAEWFGHLISLLPEDDAAARAEVLEKQARASINVAPADAVDRFGRALEIVIDPEVRARIYLGRAEARRVLGHFEAAASDLNAAGLPKDPALRFRIQHLSALIHAMQGEPARFIQEVQVMLPSAPDDTMRATLIGQIGVAEIFSGRLVAAAHLLDQASRIAPEMSYGTRILANHGWCLYLLGRYGEAHRVLNEAVTLNVARGDYWNLSTALCHSARLSAREGSFAHAFEHVTRASRIADRVPNRLHKADWQAALADILVEQGSFDEAAKTAELAAPAFLEEFEPQELSNFLMIFAEAQLGAGNVERSEFFLAKAQEHLPESPHWHIGTCRIGVEVMLARNERTNALSAAILGLTLVTEMPFERGRLLLTAARAAAACGDSTTALQWAEEARDAFADLGASHRALEAQTCVDDYTPAQKGRPRSTRPFGVTPRELEVLELVVDGMSTTEIAGSLTLSAATVKKHIENLMSKSGASRRTQLASFLKSIRDHQGR